ncbi:putative zinc-binding protein [Telluria mixta]|uniref:Zinc-binding protein n=1 Tax=Telluria mixta TaxID=34071 RepID=A0ABT2BZ59_9BURK|nr:putative zinc-binding protein [Telluria mixta]MCS0630428.1 putative zinc-binding protein [Telluria mixta]WEM94270.1 putative zinc-binding protein [Telluria mixta]
MGRDRTVFPLVYSCSGCSSAAQMANHIALELDRADVAEMSCIAGVGGDVPSLVKLAKSGRPVVAVDGCPLECVRNCLARHGVTPDLHVQLAEHGVRKRYHMQFDAAEAATVAREVADDVALLAAERRMLQPV